MLAEQLAGLENKKKPKTCMVGSFMKTLDEETLPVFIRVMKNEEVSASQILTHIKSSGYQGEITHLRDKRRECFRSEHECQCLKDVNND